MAGHSIFTGHCWSASLFQSSRATATSGYRIEKPAFRGQVLRCQSIGLSSGGIAVASRTKAHRDWGKWWFQPSPIRRKAFSFRRVMASGDGVERLLAEVEAGGNAMDAKDVAAAYYETMKQVGRMPRRRVSGVLEDDRYGALVSAVRERAPEFNGRSVAMVAYISGKAAQKGIEVPRQLLPVLIERAEEICMRMPERELATTLWAFSQNWGGSNRSTIRQAFRTVVPAVLDKIDDMSMKGASSILSSYAKEVRLAAAGSDASPRQLAMLLWSFSKLGRLPEPMVSLIIDALDSSTAPAVARKPGGSRGRSRPPVGFNNHDLCMMAWSVANHVVLKSQGQELPAFCAWSERQEAAKVLGQERQQLHLVAAVGAVMRRKQQPLDLRSAAVLAWSFARVLHYDEAEFDRIAADARAALRADGGSLPARCQQIAMLLWAFAACGHRDDGLFGDLADAALEMLASPRPQGGREDAGASAFRTADDMPQMSGTLLPCGFTTAGLSMCVWGIATIGSPTNRQRELLEALAGAAVGHVPCFGAQSLAHLCWGLAAAQCWHRPLWEQLRWAVSCLQQPEPRLFVQIAQAELVLEMEAPWIGVKAEEDLAVDTLLQGMTSVGRTRLQGRKQLLKGMLTSTRKSTRFQTHVAAAVMRLGLQPVLEHTDTGHSIDVALLQDKVAIEADGPWHFSRNTLQPLGATLMKWRCLEQLGWKVVSVPFFNWSPYGSDEDPEYQLSYLRQLLVQSGVDLDCSLSSQNARKRDDRSAPAAADVDSSAGSGADHEARRPERPPERRDNVQIDSGLVVADAETSASPAADLGVDESQPGERPGAPALKTRAALLDRVAAGRGRLSRANVLQREARRRIVKDPDPPDESNG